MNVARFALAAAVLAASSTAAQRPAVARAFDWARPLVHAAWSPGTVPPNGPASAAPTSAEWDSVREVDVSKSSAYHCETKVVREWFRSSCVAYDRWTLLKPVCKQANGDPCYVWVDPSGKGQKASIVQRLRRGQTYKLQFVWNPGSVAYDLTIAVDPAGGAVASF